jgi:transposase-like protein
MRQFKEMTDEKRLALLNEYLSSGKSKNAFEQEKGLSQHCISNWLRTFAVENKPVLLSQVAVTDMKKDPDKEELLQEIDRLKQELRLKSLDLKRTEMARDAYERMIVLAEERYGIPIRKKSDAK